MTEDDLLAIIRLGGDRIAALDPHHRELALQDLQASAERLARKLWFTRKDAQVFAEELVSTLRATPPRNSMTAVERVLH